MVKVFVILVVREIKLCGVKWLICGYLVMFIYNCLFSLLGFLEFDLLVVLLGFVFLFVRV